MNSEKLLTLATFLEALPEDRFDFSHWAGGIDLGTCGTTACALGWATAIPEFRAEGLCLYSFNGWVDVGLVGKPEAGSLQAAQAVFGVTEDQFERLFTGSDHHDAEDPYWDDNRVDDDGFINPGASAKEVAFNIRRIAANEA